MTTMDRLMNSSVDTGVFILLLPIAVALTIGLIIVATAFVFAESLMKILRRRSHE